MLISGYNFGAAVPAPHHTAVCRQSIMSTEGWVVGIDGGATKTVALILDGEGAIKGRGTEDATNQVSVVQSSTLSGSLDLSRASHAHAHAHINLGRPVSGCADSMSACAGWMP